MCRFFCFVASLVYKKLTLPVLRIDLMRCGVRGVRCGVWGVSCQDNTLHLDYYLISAYQVFYKNEVYIGRNERLMTDLTPIPVSPARSECHPFLKSISLLYECREQRSVLFQAAGTIQKLALEMRTRFGKYKPLYLAKVWMTSLMAPYYFKTKSGKNYLDQLVDMSDTLIIDGKINTVISGSIQQREKLLAVLDSLEKEGDILYGFYVSEESVLSCYVRSLDESHIHFVDGAKGGYTQAAGMLKKKVREVIKVK
jgi:hypothetical protein